MKKLGNLLGGIFMANESTKSGVDKTAVSPECCQSKVLESKTLNECDSKCYTPMGCPGPIVAKIPVVLANVEIQIDVEASIKLSKEALDVKTIDKQIFITQCKLVPFTDKLFIAGYVQKNIQFSTIDCVNKTSISGEINHTTAKIPFNCVTRIKLFKEPQYGKEDKKRFNVLDKNMLGIDTKEESWVHYSKFEEKVFCELEAVKIAETDIFNKEENKKESILEKEGFNEILEKMVINIKLKVLQKQKVFIPGYDSGVDVIEAKDQGLSHDMQTNAVHIELGHDINKGIVAKEVSNNIFSED